MARTATPGALELLRGAARGDDLDAQLGEARREVDDPALVGNRQQSTADPDGPRLREWLPRPGGGVLGDARSIGEARRVRAPCEGTPALCREPATEAGHGHARRPALSTSWSAPATSSRSASSASTTTSTRRAGGAARREDADPFEDAGDGRRRRRSGGEDPDGFDDPEADDRRRGRGLGARPVDEHAPRVARVAAHRARAISATASRQQLVLERAQRSRTVVGVARARQLDRAPAGRSARCRPPRRRGGP